MRRITAAGKSQALALLQKREHVAAGLAAEAVPQALRRRDRERGLVIVVKRAAREEALADLAQLEPGRADHLGEVHAGFEVVEIGA